MAQKIIIPAHHVALADIRKSIKNGKFTKLYFQCALKEIRSTGSDLEAEFGIIVYAAKRDLAKNWKPGKKVDCRPDYTVPPAVFNLADYDDPVAFANNEVTEFSVTKKKNKNVKKWQSKQTQLMQSILQSCKDPVASKTASLTLRAGISSNPHITYDISLDGTSAPANPSPPAPPY